MKVLCPLGLKLGGLGLILIASWAMLWRSGLQVKGMLANLGSNMGALGLLGTMLVGLEQHFKMILASC